MSTSEPEKNTLNKADDKTTNIIDFFANLIDPKKTHPGDLIKFAIGLVMLCITFSVFYYASKDPKALTEEFYLYIFFGIIPIIIGIFIVSNIFIFISISFSHKLYVDFVITYITTHLPIHNRVILYQLTPSIWINSYIKSEIICLKLN